MSSNASDDIGSEAVRLARTQYRPFSYSLDELRSRPPRAWCLDGLLAPQEITVLWGDPKSGKSALALSIAYQMAVGCETIHGHSATQQRVLYVAAEGQQDIIGRIQLLTDRFGHTAAFRLRDRVIDLRVADAADTDALINDLRQQRITLLVLDTLARMLGAADENSSRDMGGFVQALGRIIEETGVAMLLIHHGRKSQSGGAEDLRGHGNLRAAVDTVACVRKRAGDLRVVAVNESRAGMAGRWCAFRLSAESLGPNDGSAVVVHDVRWDEFAKHGQTRAVGAQGDSRGSRADDAHEASLAVWRGAVSRAVEQEGFAPPTDSTLPPGTVGAHEGIINQELDRLRPNVTPTNRRKLRQKALDALETKRDIQRDRTNKIVWLLPIQETGADSREP